jgi:hypothetical protein
MEKAKLNGGSVHSNAMDLNLWLRGACGQTKAACTLCLGRVPVTASGVAL